MKNFKKKKHDKRLDKLDIKSQYQIRILQNCGINTLVSIRIHENNGNLRSRTTYI